jgi:hypothetical protein
MPDNLHHAAHLTVPSLMHDDLDNRGFVWSTPEPLRARRGRRAFLSWQHQTAREPRHLLRIGISLHSDTIGLAQAL